MWKKKNNNLNGGGYSELSGKKNRFFRIFNIVFLSAAVLCGAVFASAGLSTETEAFYDASKFVKVDEIMLDNYDTRTDGKAFNESALESLYAKLSGGAATLDAVKTKVNASSCLGVTSLNSKMIRGLNGGKNVSLQFAGKNWTVMNVSFADNNFNADGSANDGSTNVKKGDVLLTLYLLDDANTYQWSTYDNQGSVSQTYPCRVYGTSYIRSAGLNIGSEYTLSNGATLNTVPQSTSHEFAKFTMTKAQGVSDSVINYLVKPKFCYYQSYINRYQFLPNSTRTDGNYVNDCYGTPGTAYYGNIGDLSGKHNYSAWQNDPIWLPAATETGWSVSGSEGLWYTDEAQKRQTETAANAAFRSCGVWWNNACVIQSTCGFSGTYTFKSQARPALHLNLSAAAAAAGFEDPSDVNTPYNGQIQTPATVAAGAPASAAWYSNKFADATVAKTTYYKSGTAISDADMIDAGEYEVEIELLNGNAWKNATSPTDTKRRVKFTIAKKSLAVNFTVSVDNTARTVTPNVSYTVSEVYPRDSVNFIITYTGKVGTNRNPAAAGYNSTTAPTAYGDYTATVTLQDAATSNYTLTGTLARDFVLTKDKAQAPTITVANATKTYNATLQQVTLTNFDATKVTVSGLLKKDSSGSYVPTTDVTWTSPNTYVEVKNAGEYRLEFSVLNGYEWSDGSADSVKKTASFTVKPKELTVAVTNDEATNSWGWQGGSTITIKIAVSGVESGDNIAFDGFYYDNNSPATPVDTQAGVLNSTSGAYEATLVVSGTASTGTYTVNANLTAGVDQTDNYVLPSGTGAALPKSFTVLAQNVNVSLLSWQVVASNDPTSTPVAIAENGTVKYGLYDVSGTATPITYTVQLDTTNFTAMYLLIDTSTKPTGYTNNSGSAVNTYTTTVDIKAADNDHKILDGSGNPVSSITLTLHWEIVKGDFDLSGIVWEYVGTDGVTVNDYTRPLSYADGLMYTVRVKASSMPVGLTLNSSYTGMKRAVIGNHTAQLTSADVTYDTANFNAPDWTQTVLNWEITKKQIPLDWKLESHSNSNPSGKDYNISVINCDPALASNIGYKYYDSTGQELTLAQIDAMAVGSAQFTIKVEAYLIGGTSEYMLGDGTTNDFTTTFEVGDGKPLVNVDIADKDNAVYEAGKQHFLPTDIKLTNNDTGNALNTNLYNIYYYTGTSADPAKLLPAGTYPEAAGDYYVQVELTAAASGAYSLSKSGFVLTIARQKLAVPTFTATQFTGNDITLESCLTGYDANLMEIVGDATGRNARTYSAIIRLKDIDNYEWDTATVTPAPVSYIGKLTATINGADCELDWNIEKAVVKADWKTDGDVPVITSLNAFKELIDQQRLAVEYHYVDTATGEEVTTMEGGKSYEVRAVLVGEDADNIVFEDTQRTDTKMTGTFSAPQNGFLAAMGKIGSMLATNWWWLLIALGILLFLILLIVLIKRSKKKKEEKLAKKEAAEEKAERKRRREEEEEEERQRRKRRREEEEEDERRRRKAQLEAQQQPAAQPQSNMMAQPQMQQMPMPQPVIMAQPAIVQQPAPQPQPQQQPKPAEKPKILIRSHSSESDERVKAAEERARRAEELLRKALDDRARNTVNASREGAPAYAPFAGSYAPSPELRAAEERAKAAEERMERMAEERVRAAEERARMAEMQTVYANNRQPAQNNAPAAPQSAEIQALEARLRAAEDRARTAEEHSRMAEERAMRAEFSPAHYAGYMGAMQPPAQNIASEVVNALLLAAVRGLTGNQPAQGAEEPKNERNVLPITFKAVSSENVDTSEEVAKVTMPTVAVGTPAGTHVLPPDAVMTTTTTTTVDTTGKKKQPERRELYDTDTLGKKHNS